MFKRPPTDEETRFILAIMLMLLVAGLGLLSVVQPSAASAFEKLLPILSAVFGYFCGRYSGSRRNG